MAKSRRRNPVKVPDPRTVVLEFDLMPPAGLMTPSARVAAQPKAAYRVLRTTQVDPYDTQPSLSAAIATARPSGESFQGKARRAAKISVSNARIEKFSDLKDLIDTLPTDAIMKRHKPPITVTSKSDRVSEEDRNVRVRAFLYAASREDDNDFHLIIGRAPSLKRAFMTMEVSGLPPTSSAHLPVLKRARDAYKSFFQHHDLGLPGTSYDFYVPPIPVEITGSLFWDKSHVKGGRPGPKDLRPDIPTIWEIHPITRIVFEP